MPSLSDAMRFATRRRTTSSSRSSPADSPSRYSNSSSIQASIDCRSSACVGGRCHVRSNCTANAFACAWSTTIAEGSDAPAPFTQTSSANNSAPIARKCSSGSRNSRGVRIYRCPAIGVYQIGDVKPRSCNVIFTDGGIFEWKRTTS